MSALRRPPAARGLALRPLLELIRRYPDFRRLFCAAVVSLLGDWFAFVAVSGLVTDLTGSEGTAAVVFAASVLPVFLASPVAGVVADRVNRKTMLIVADVARIVPALGLLAAAQLELAWLAIACVVAIATMAAFFEPVVSAVLPNVVEERDLSLAQSTMGAVWGSMLFLGAAVGGLVAATLGRDASFILNAFTFAVSAAFVLRIRSPLRRGEVGATAGVLAHFSEVWRFVRPRKVTRALLFTKTGVGIAGGIVGLLPAYAVLRFGSGDAGIGVLLAARGLGAFVGPFLARSMAGTDGRRLLLVCGGSIVSYGVAYAFLPLTASLPLAAVCVALAHAGGGAQWVLSVYGLQITTPDGVRGRVMSLDFGLATLAMGVSALAAGGAVEMVGLRTTSWGIAAVAFAYGGAWLWWTHDLWTASTDPVGRPALAVSEPTT